MLIPLKLLRDKPLQQQLHEQLRELIISSRLAPGARMPSTRLLAEQFSISRITALLTYERLIAEGYLRTIPAKGTFVHRADSFPPAEAACRVSAERVVGRPDPKLFPAAKWRALIRAALDKLGTDPADGEPALRQAIARWLATSRGLAVGADQIILAHGRQHALHIAAHLLLRPGDQAIVEAPGDPAVERLLSGEGARVAAVPVDDEGLRTELLPAGPAAMVLVTPEHQRPSGVAMSLRRREALLAWARRSGATVVEDDADGELRYEAAPAPPLMRLDRDETVIHAGDFGATLGVGVALGYLAVPRRLTEAAGAAGAVVGGYAGRLEADALAALLDSGGYARHLLTVRQTYLARRDTLVRSLRRHFGEDVAIAGTAAGLHIAWTRPSAAAVADMALRLGLDAGSCGEDTVLLGFGLPPERQIEIGVAQLAEALAEALPGALPGALNDVLSEGALAGGALAGGALAGGALAGGALAGVLADAERGRALPRG
jgi:GntR family transcriptional regulator/MocR family aminotransferase